MTKVDILNEDKQKIYEVINRIKGKTEMQKERFVRYMGLKPTEFRKENYRELGERYNCSTSAIRCSVVTVKAALYRIKDEDYEILEEIYKKYQQ